MSICWRRISIAFAEPAGVSRLVKKRRSQRIECDGVGGKPQPFSLGVGRGAVAFQDVTDPSARAPDPPVEPVRDKRQDRLRKDERRNGARAQNAEGDFLDAGDGRIEDRLGGVHRREPHNRRAITRQHQDVTSGRSIKKRKIETKTHPGGYGQREQHGRVDQVGNEHDADACAKQCAANPVKGFGAGGAC